MGIEALLTSQVIGLDAALSGKLSTSGGTVTGQLTNALGTITASTPLTISQTWNNAAVTFNPLLVNVTDTQSASGSLLMDLQVGGASKFKVDKAGSIFSKASLGNSVTVLGDDRSSIITEQGGGWLGWTIRNGNSAQDIVSFIAGGGDSNVRLRIDGQLQWSSSSSWNLLVAQTPDLVIRRDAADTLAQRRSTNAQTFRIYNTYTSSTSFENLQLQWSSNEARIGTSVGSAGGTARDIVIGAWDSAGTFVPGLTITRGTGSGDSLYWRGATGSSSTSIRLRASGVTNYIYFGQNLLCAGGTNINNNVVFYPPLQYTPNAQTSGAITEWQWTAAAHTGQTASTEASSVVFDLSATKTFAAGALTTQRAFRIQAPTYAFASASTITTASTLSISGAPTAGTNATITNAYALNVESGISNFSGQLTNALGTITASTPATFTQTWNNVATTFTGILANVTDTASASGSLLMDLQVGGTSKFKVGKDGSATFTDSANIAVGTTTGTKIGTGTTQKLGFYNATPVDQPDTVADPSGGAIQDAEARTAINAIIDRLQELGLIA